MGTGITMAMGFPLESHGNGVAYLLMGMGMIPLEREGMGTTAVIPAHL